MCNWWNHLLAKLTLVPSFRHWFKYAEIWCKVSTVLFCQQIILGCGLYPLPISSIWVCFMVNLKWETFASSTAENTLQTMLGVDACNKVWTNVLALWSSGDSLRSRLYVWIKECQFHEIQSHDIETNPSRFWNYFSGAKSTYSCIGYDLRDVSH